MLASRLPIALATGTSALVDAGMVALLGVALARSGRAVAVARARGEAATGAGWRTLDRFSVLGLVGAGALFGWIVRHPTPHFHQLFARGDHLAFALLLGWVVVRMPLAGRPWLVAAVSIVWLVQYSGPLAIAVALAAGLLGYAALRLPAVRRPWPAVALHAALAVAVYRFCWHVRGTNVLEALQVYGLFSFVFLRQISFATATLHARPAGVGGYLCYLTFYPGITGPLGGPEVWSEFARRNLGTRTEADYDWAARKVVRGMAQIWIADRIPISAETVFASASTPLAWLASFALFVQVVLRGMGFWAMIDATASFYGFRLRPNFDGILRARNPSELWRSWRGTFTNWLVCHVYGPLGGNRRHHSLNIAAAFAVTLLWHWGGVPFLSGDFGLAHLAPITLWAIVNALAVIGHAQAVRRQWALLPEATPPAIRLAIHRVFTMGLGTLSVTVPYTQLGAQDAFLPLVRRLIGLGS
jgi:hypothetical protein